MKKLTEIAADFESKCIDGRDAHRLADFFPEEDLYLIGISMKEEYKGTHEYKPLTKVNILEQLKKDVDFGVEKALNQRGISTSLMSEVVKMWNWILEDGLEDFSEEGMSLFIETARIYGWEV